MSFDKTKFTANPQLDSEGFVMSDARCWGCPGDMPCSRSGSCDRYMSPLRFYNHQTITIDDYKVVSVVDVLSGDELSDVPADVKRVVGEMLLNPPGWNEPGMQPITWAERCCSLRQESQTAYESGLAIDIHEELFRQ